jgi:hypothetical protein
MALFGDLGQSQRSVLEIYSQKTEKHKTKPNNQNQKKINKAKTKAKSK